MQPTMDTNHLVQLLIHIPATATYAFLSSNTLATWRGPHGLQNFTIAVILVVWVAETFALRLSLVLAVRSYFFTRIKLGPVLQWVIGGVLTRFTLTQLANTGIRGPNESSSFVRFCLKIYERAYTRIYLEWLFSSMCWMPLLVMLYWGPALVDTVLFMAFNLGCNVLRGAVMMLILLGICTVHFVLILLVLLMALVVLIVLLVSTSLIGLALLALVPPWVLCQMAYEKVPHAITSLAHLAYAAIALPAANNDGAREICSDLYGVPEDRLDDPFTDVPAGTPRTASPRSSTSCRSEARPQPMDEGSSSGTTSMATTTADMPHLPVARGSGGTSEVPPLHPPLLEQQPRILEKALVVQHPPRRGIVLPGHSTLLQAYEEALEMPP